MVALSPRSRLAQPFQLACSYAALPRGHEQAFGEVLRRVSGLVRGEALEEAVGQLDALIERQEAEFTQQGRWTGPPLPPYLVPCLVYASLLDLQRAEAGSDLRMFDGLPAGGAEGGAQQQGGGSGGEEGKLLASGGDAAAVSQAVSEGEGEERRVSRRSALAAIRQDAFGRLMLYQLEQRTKAAPRDSLAPLGAAMTRVLGGCWWLLRAVGCWVPVQGGRRPGRVWRAGVHCSCTVRGAGARGWVAAMMRCAGRAPVPLTGHADEAGWLGCCCLQARSTR